MADGSAISYPDPVRSVREPVQCSRRQRYLCPFIFAEASSTTGRLGLMSRTLSEIRHPHDEGESVKRYSDALDPHASIVRLATLAQIVAPHLTQSVRVLYMSVCSEKLNLFLLLVVGFVELDIIKPLDRHELLQPTKLCSARWPSNNSTSRWRFRHRLGGLNK